MEVDVERQRAMLLISRCDRLAADQAVSDPDAGLFAVATKQNGQGNAFSAHIAIHLVPVRGHTYLAVLEDSTGINSKVVCQLLRSTLKASAGVDPTFFEHPDPSGAVDSKGNPLLLRSRYKFEMVGHPSDDFEQELNSGLLNGIEVLDYKNQNNVWDEDKTATEKARVIYLKPKEKDGTPLWEVVTSICKTAHKQDLSQIRVRFTDSAKFAHTVTLETERMAIVNEDRFVKRERLAGFKAKLDTGCQTINPEMRARMFPLVK
jgi:hypothetical protein